MHRVPHRPSREELMNMDVLCWAPATGGIDRGHRSDRNEVSIDNGSIGYRDMLEGLRHFDMRNDPIRGEAGARSVYNVYEIVLI